MHNCKETRDIFTELLLDGVDFAPDQAISAELSRCAECRSEFEALSATLRMTHRVSEVAAPAEDYWPAYHSKLRQRLASSTSRAKAQRHKDELGPLFEPLRPGAGTSLFVRLLKTSVPVPLPLGVAMVIATAALFLSLVIPLAISAARKDVQQPTTTTIVRVPVEVPVVQEKVVTRVVYRDRRPIVAATKRATEDAAAESTFAKSQRSRTEAMPPGLSGFKPSDEIKLTVIKGGVPNER